MLGVVVQAVVRYYQIVLELRLIEICILTYFLAPCCFIVKVYKFAVELSFRRHITRFCFPEPSMVLFVKQPILPFELHSSKILLVSALLVIESKEKCFQVKPLEVFPPIIHRHCWKHVVLSQRNWMLCLLHLLILGLRDIAIGCL